MERWTATQSFPSDPSCFAPSYMFPHLMIREARSLLIRKKKYSGASPLATWLSSRCPSLSKRWMTWPAPLLGALVGLRGNSQTERLSRLSIQPPCHSARHVPLENRSASMGWCSAPLQCWGRWRSFCSSHQHQELGGASWLWVAPESVEVLDPKVK